MALPTTSSSDPVPAGHELLGGGAILGDEHFYEGVLALAADAIVITDGDQRIVTFNRAAVRVFGHQAEEVLGRPLEMLLPPRFAATHRERDVPAFERSGGAPRRMGERSEVRGLRKSGEEFPAEVSIARAELGGQPRYVAIVRDVSERHRAELELRESEELFRTAMHSSPIGMALRGLDGRWLAVNRALCEIVGYTEEELRGLSVADLSHPDDLQTDMDFADELLAGTRAPYSREKRYVHKNGNTVWILLAVTLVRGANGEPRFFITQMKDITDRKRAEELLARQAAELARSNAELERFAYVASHDLQEPLRMVASYSQLLARHYQGRLDEKADRWIGYAVDGARRMQALINDLLALSRVGTHGRPFAPTDCGEVLARALGSLAPAIAAGDVRITSDPLPVVLGDATQLEQVFQNLVGNAIKFRRPEVPCEVHVGAERTTDAGRDAWLLTVRDNGIGLDMAYAEQVFTMFQRLHTREEYAGTGIGLAICRKIVERHGGRIWVESTPGAGASFHFTLPVESRP
ncbi:MAG TPA: PAS domain S-box protein [Gemmatimonadaceae bacterium]